MSNSNLDFLNDLYLKSDYKSKQLKYLETNFEKSIWKIRFDDNTTREIDFNIKLADNLYLTSPKHNKLLDTLKYWILENIISSTTGLTLATETIRSQINCVLSFFDYMNINDSESKISKFGFQGLTIDFIKGMFNEISSNSFKNESIYKVSNKLTKYFRENISPLNDNVEQFNEYGVMKISENEIDLFQDYLMKNKDFKVSNFYPNALNKPYGLPSEFKKNKNNSNQKEYNSYYRLKEEGKPMTKVVYLKYKQCFMTLNNLRNNKELLMPLADVFDCLYKYEPEIRFNKRFETVPSSVIFELFKKAIDFHYNYGDDIVNSYIEFEKNVDNKKLSIIETNKILNTCITPKMKELGVKEWTNRSSQNQFEELRENKALRDLIQVYLGSIQFVVGALMARRQSELKTLVVNECIDDVNKLLLFKRSKSTKGLFGTKDTLALPIDELGISMLKNIEKIHKYQNKKTYLFTVPSYDTPLSRNSTADYSYNVNLDRFFDYVESPVKNGKRLYLRQHQLRRFFAMSFFWGNGFGSMDTLRWFMGHTDVEHLYHYITETMSGEVLRSTKAQYVAENINDFEDLRSLIKSKYKSDDFSLIETEDLTYYIEDLIEEGKVEVEPEFIEDDNGKKYKIIVKVRSLES